MTGGKTRSAIGVNCQILAVRANGVVMPVIVATSSRFHNRLVQQERYHSYMKDATFVGPRPLVAAGNDYLSEKIACHLQGPQFLIRLVRTSHVKRALEIEALEPRIDDKVYFIRSSLAFP